MTKEQLLEALSVERQDQTWWRHRPTHARPTTWADDQFIDDDVTCARRRKALAEAWGDTQRQVG